MELKQIIERILYLQNWLIENPNSPERSLIESDIKNLQFLLEEKFYKN